MDDVRCRQSYRGLRLCFIPCIHYPSSCRPLGSPSTHLWHDTIRLLEAFLQSNVEEPYALTAMPLITLAEQDHRGQPAMAGEFFREISSVNTAIAGGWVQTLCQNSIKPLHMPAETTVDFANLIEWYRSQCDDWWEHQHGIKLDTLDNPGWMLTVDLIGTDLQGKPMIELREGVSPTAHPVSPRWIQCSVTDNQFRGACDPSQVARLFNVFNHFRCSPNSQK